MAIGILDHIGIVVDDIETARHVFGNVFKLPEVAYSNSPERSAYAFRAGGTLIRVVTHQAPEADIGGTGIHHLAFSVNSLSDLKLTLQKFRISVLPNSPPDPDGLPSIWTDPAETIGIPLQFVEQSKRLEFPQASSDSFIKRIDHIGVACKDNQNARRVYVEQFGFAQECTQIDAEILVPIEICSNDKYGCVTRARPPQHRVGSGLTALFVTVGDFELELMQPLSASKLEVPLGSIPGTVGQDQGAISRFLERRGEGLLHIGFKTPDIQKALDSVANSGVKLIDSIGRPGGRASLIAFIDLHSTGGILFHFVQRTPY